MCLLRDWFQLFRAHTAMGTTILVLIFYFIGGGKIDNLLFIFVFLAGLFTHYIGSGHNTVMDYIAGYDMFDPNKKHFPIQRGAIKQDTAKTVILLLLALNVLFTVWITLTFGANKVYALTFLILAFVFGVIYNDGLGKTISLKFIIIYFYYTSLGAWAYFLVSNTITPILQYLSLYVFFEVWIQIGFEGELKEIENKVEANLLRALGATIYKYRYTKEAILGIEDKTKYERKFFMPTTFVYVFVGIGVLGKFLAAYYIYTFVKDLLSFSVAFLFLVFASYYTYKQTKYRVYNRDEDLKNMAITEVFSIFAALVLVSPYCGYLVAVFIMIIAILYFVVFNKWLWSTTIEPKV